MWVGEKHKVENIAEDFKDRLNEIAPPEEFDLTERFVGVTNFLADNSAIVSSFAGSLCWVRSEFSPQMLQMLRETHAGHNWIVSTRVESVCDIKSAVDAADQTIAHFGLEASEITNLLETLLSSGIDRIVDIGSALEFDHLWDGRDLIADFSKKIRVQV